MIGIESSSSFLVFCSIERKFVVKNHSNVRKHLSLCQSYRQNICFALPIWFPPPQITQQANINRFFVKLITMEDIFCLHYLYFDHAKKKAQTKKALILANNDRDLGTAWNHRWNWTVLLQPMSNGTKRLQKSKGHYWSHVISDVSIIFKQNSINQANSLYLKRPRAPEICASQCNWLILSYCRQFYITASKWLWTITLDAWHSMSLLFLST